MDSLLDFTNRIVLITGAGSGFGRLLAKGLAERGAKLVLTDIDEKGLQAITDELLPITDVEMLTGDISSEALNKELVDVALAKFGRLDIAVNLSLIHI